MSVFLQDEVYTPFQSGDVIVSATMITDQRLRFGLDRIRQLGPDLARKADLHTDHYGIIAGMGRSPAGTLYVLDGHAHSVVRVAPDGRPLPPIEIAPGVPLGSIHFLPDGSYLCGEHHVGLKPPFVGNGNVYRFDAHDRLRRIYRTDTHGGMAGFLGVTHIALAPDGRTLRYVSETGPRLMQYDLEADAQLPDLYNRDDPPGMCFGLCHTPDGDVLMATGSGVRRIDSLGKVVRDYQPPAGRGWAIVTPSLDGTSFWCGDFFGGTLARLSYDTGEVLMSETVCDAFSLTAIVEIP